MHDLQHFGRQSKHKINDLKCFMHEYSFEKFLKRFKKGAKPYGWYDRLKDNLLQKLHKDDHSSVARGLIVPVQRIIECFEEVCDLVGSSQKFPRDFGQFKLALELATTQTKIITDDQNAILYISSIDPIYLKFIRKVSSLTHSIDILIQATYSPRVRRWPLSKKLELVPSLQETIEFPKESDEYQKLAKSAVSSQGQEFQDDEYLASNRATGLGFKTLAVHSESAPCCTS